MAVQDIFRTDDPFRARACEVLVRVRNPGDGRCDQVVMQKGDKVTWAEVTPDRAIQLAEDLLAAARRMKAEGRGA